MQNIWCTKYLFTTYLNLIISHSEFSHPYTDWHNFLHTSIRRVTNGVYGFPEQLRRPVVLSRERTYIRLFRFLSPVRDCCHLLGYLTYSPGLNEDGFLRIEASFLDCEIKVHVRQFLPGKVCEQFKTFIGVSLFCDKFN